jgi:hypothetical protein
VVECVVQLQIRRRKLVREERQRERREWGRNRRHGDVSLQGNRRDLAVALRSSGEKFCRPGGEFARGSRGETERRGRATYRHWEESKRARIKAGLSERGRVTVSRNGRRRGFDPGKKNLTSGAGLSAGRRGIRAYRFGRR